MSLDLIPLKGHEAPDPGSQTQAAQLPIPAASPGTGTHRAPLLPREKYWDRHHQTGPRRQKCPGCFPHCSRPHGGFPAPCTRTRPGAGGQQGPPSTPRPSGGRVLVLLLAGLGTERSWIRISRRSPSSPQGTRMNLKISLPSINPADVEFLASTTNVLPEVIRKTLQSTGSG